MADTTLSLPRDIDRIRTIDDAGFRRYDMTAIDLEQTTDEFWNSLVSEWQGETEVRQVILRSLTGKQLSDIMSIFTKRSHTPFYLRIWDDQKKETADLLKPIVKSYPHICVHMFNASDDHSQEINKISELNHRSWTKYDHDAYFYSTRLRWWKEREDKTAENRPSYMKIDDYNATFRRQLSQGMNIRHTGDRDLVIRKHSGHTAHLLAAYLEENPTKHITRLQLSEFSDSDLDVLLPAINKIKGRVKVEFQKTYFRSEGLNKIQNMVSNSPSAIDARVMSYDVTFLEGSGEADLLREKIAQIEKISEENQEKWSNKEKNRLNKMDEPDDSNEYALKRQRVIDWASQLWGRIADKAKAVKTAVMQRLPGNKTSGSASDLAPVAPPTRGRLSKVWEATKNKLSWKKKAASLDTALVPDKSEQPNADGSLSAETPEDEPEELKPIVSDDKRRYRRLRNIVLNEILPFGAAAAMATGIIVLGAVIAERALNPNTNDKDTDSKENRTEVVIDSVGKEIDSLNLTDIGRISKDTAITVEEPAAPVEKVIDRDLRVDSVKAEQPKVIAETKDTPAPVKAGGSDVDKTSKKTKSDPDPEPQVTKTSFKSTFDQARADMWKSYDPKTGKVESSTFMHEGKPYMNIDQADFSILLAAFGDKLPADYKPSDKGTVPEKVLQMMKAMGVSDTPNAEGLKGFLNMRVTDNKGATVTLAQIIQKASAGEPVMAHEAVLASYKMAAVPGNKSVSRTEAKEAEQPVESRIVQSNIQPLIETDGLGRVGVEIENAAVVAAAIPVSAPALTVNAPEGAAPESPAGMDRVESFKLNGIWNVSSTIPGAVIKYNIT